MTKEYTQAVSYTHLEVYKRQGAGSLGSGAVTLGGNGDAFLTLSLIHI